MFCIAKSAPGNGNGNGRKPTPGTKLVGVIIILELMAYTQLTATKVGTLEQEALCEFYLLGRVFGMESGVVYHTWTHL